MLAALVAVATGHGSRGYSAMARQPEESERSRWVDVLAALVQDTLTPAGRVLSTSPWNKTRGDST